MAPLALNHLVQETETTDDMSTLWMSSSPFRTQRAHVTAR